MSNLTNLYRFAENEGIEVFDFDLPLNQSLSIMDAGGKCSIAIDPFSISSTAEETVHLAHELGHCKTGSFYNRFSNYDIRAKAEHRADKWAIKKLIPLDELKEAFSRGIVEPWDLAEYFDVTEQFIAKAVEFYKNNYNRFLTDFK